MHTNPVVSCSLFVERWDTYQQGSLISRKLIYLAKSYSASFLIFPAFHGNQTKWKKFVINASTFSQKPQNASSFWTFRSYISNSNRNKTKPNQIQFEISSDCQFKLTKKKKRFTLVSRSLLEDSSSDWLVEFFGNCLSESSRINSTHNKH